MSSNRKCDPRNTKSQLGQAYWQHYSRVMDITQPKIMGDISITVLEGIESFATDNPMSSLYKIWKDMLDALGPDKPAGDPETVKRFRSLYKEASDIVFPATNAYLKVCHALNQISTSYSLSLIELDILQDTDLKAHCDSVLDTFRNDLKYKLDNVSQIDDTTAYSQAFEIYGEILAYRHLQKRVYTERIPERKNQKSPDFLCKLPDDRYFYVEVKTFDIAGGDFRQSEMMDDALESKVDLEKQLLAGKSHAMAETEFPAYRKAGETETYDPRSIIRVIDTLREKSLTAFKEGQFDEGPTIALVVIDRLVLPGGSFSLRRCYIDSHDGGITSGVLWHMAYGRSGTQIFRPPAFAGANSLEGQLDKLGLFVDETRPFPGLGLVFLHRTQCGRRAYGLVNGAYSTKNNWSVENTQDILNQLCDFWNDEDDSCTWNIPSGFSTQCDVEG